MQLKHSILKGLHCTIELHSLELGFPLSGPYKICIFAYLMVNLLVKLLWF